jgi:hypothetical protein
LALGIYDHALDNNIETEPVSSEAKQAIQIARGQFVTAPALSTVQGNDRKVAGIVIKESLAESIQIIMLVCAGLALAGAASGVLLPSSPNDRPSSK